MTVSALPQPAMLNELREFFAAGYFERPDAAPMARAGRAARRRFEHRPPPSYAGGPLYPCGINHDPDNRIMSPRFSAFFWRVDEGELRSALEKATPGQRPTLEALGRETLSLQAQLNTFTTPHTVGGAGWTHSIPHYDRVLAEGLNGYARRIDSPIQRARAARHQTKVEFYEALQDVLIGIRDWHRRLLRHLRSCRSGATATRELEALIAAFDRVPFEPARTFYEALVAFNVIFYLDECDNPGRLDQALEPYYQRDRQAGLIDADGAIRLLRQFYDNVCANHGWSAAIGGTTPDGAPAYNEMTRLCLRASPGRFRPSLELRTRRDMPEDLWDVALETLATGNGQPAFYNETAYLQALREADLGLSAEDLVKWNGGGCTETMVHGCSNVGSLDSGLNVPLVLEDTLNRHLAEAGLTFDGLLAQFRANLAAVIGGITDDINRNQKVRAERYPQPMRTLLIDDCIDRGVEFNAGGARYNWSVVNIAGLANVADSLVAVREMVFEKRVLSGGALLALLRSNFAENEAWRRRLSACPRFGNDNPSVDALAADIAQFIFTEFARYPCWRGGRFLPSCIMFETYAAAGHAVGATPDGRLAGDPLADSAGPVQGRDTHGPTAMLKSVAALPQRLAPGTLVLNMRFSKAALADRAGRQRVRHLIESYFLMGGMQVQISVTDRTELEDAMAHPERHADLIVRIGGYSTHFNWLSTELKQAVLARTEFSS